MNLLLILIILIQVIVLVYFFLYLQRKNKAAVKNIEGKYKEKLQELRKKNTLITDSIRYAQTIQQAIFPPMSGFTQEVPGAFILHRPKDYVSGDFFWYIKRGNNLYFAVGDCTGHGVPGAFMSLIANDILKNIAFYTDVNNPAEILRLLNLHIRVALKQKGKHGDVFDGLDISLCVLTRENELSFAGAKRPLYLVRNNELTIFKGAKYSIGGAYLYKKKEYSSNSINLKKNDSIYLFSDGFADQFGGPGYKKYGIKNFRNLLLKASAFKPEEQGRLLRKTFETYTKDVEQIDDVIVLGVKF